MKDKQLNRKKKLDWTVHRQEAYKNTETYEK